MNNQSVAKIIENLADLTEIKGGDTYRIRAYRRAASEIAGLAENLDEINRRGELKEIPGIGESIASKIRDILETGTTPAYEKLRAEFPEGLTEMLSVPSMGPKTVKQIYEKLGIKSVDELEQAAREGRLSNDAGLAKKTEEGILRGIEIMRMGQQRLSLGVALPLAEEVIERMKRVRGVKQISAAGSIRRRKDTIGDIDLVAESTDRDAVVAFTNLPQVREIIEVGPTMSSVWTKAGLRMDLRIAEPEHYGAMLHHFTGSKQHSIKLRGMARDRGLTINDYGVFRLDTGEQVTAGRTEEDIYEALGLPWIPPELREDRGEVEAALRGRLPDLVDVADIRGDLHCHTTASDGRNTIQELADAAQARGYSYIAICDHSKSLGIAHGLSEDRLLKQIDQIHDINRSLDGFRVLAGIEVDILADGKMDVDPGIVKKLDIAVASLHQRHKQNREQLTQRVIKAIETGLVDILAHPTGRLINQRDPYDIDLDRIMDAAAAHGTAMEINCNPDRLDLNDTYVRAARNRGIKIAIDTDAHSLYEFANIRLGLAMARRAWLEPSNILNAWPVDELLDWLHTRRAGKRLPAGAR